MCEGPDGFIFLSEREHDDYVMGHFYVSVGDSGPQEEYEFLASSNNTDVALRLVRIEGNLYGVKTPGGTIQFKLRDISKVAFWSKPVNAKYVGKSDKVPEGSLWAVDCLDGEELEILCQEYDTYFFGEGE